MAIGQKVGAVRSLGLAAKKSKSHNRPIFSKNEKTSEKDLKS